MLHIEIIHHIHLNAGIEGIAGSFLSVSGHALVDQLYHGIPVRNDKAVMPPFFLEHLCQCVPVSGCRGTADVVE